jgi:uncharacterized protein YbjT (DUF2867 family)
MADNQREMEMNGEGAHHAAVLGSSGFIGTYLTLELLKAGYHVHLLSHKINPDFVSVRGRVTTVSGAIEDEDSLIRCFTGCRTVFHLVGIIAETRDKTFQRTVADGTAKVVAAAKKCGVQKIIYLSALGTEEKAVSRYFRAKWEAEQHIIRSGLGFAIFRPSIVYGIEDKFINMLADMIRRGPAVPVIGDGLYEIQPVYVEELCAVAARAALKDETTGQIYEVVGPERLTYLALLDIIMRIVGKKRSIIHVPVFAARGAAWMMGKVIKPAPLTGDMINMLLAGSTGDGGKVEKAFGVKFTSLETQLQKYLGRRDGKQRI